MESATAIIVPLAFRSYGSNLKRMDPEKYCPWPAEKWLGRKCDEGLNAFDHLGVFATNDASGDAMNTPPIPVLINTSIRQGRIRSRLFKNRCKGNGPDFVLIHGLGMSGRSMLPTAALLCNHGTVYIPDLPGFGDSFKPPVVYDLPALADILKQWMDACLIEKPVLIGNSLGGQIIAEFASRFPGDLSCAVLVGSTMDPQGLSISQQVCRLVRDIPLEPLGLYWIGMKDYFKAGWRTMLTTLKHALRHPMVDCLSKIQTPVLLLRGDADPVVPQAWMEMANSILSNSKLVVLPNRGHALTFSAPVSVAGETLLFMENEAL